MSTHTQVASAASERRFFALNATYFIDPKASPTALADDASALIGRVLATMKLVAMSLGSLGPHEICDEEFQEEVRKNAASSLWGAVQQMEMIQNLVNTIEVAE